MGPPARPKSIPCVCGSLSCQVFQSKDVPDKSTTPEEFTRMTKGITIATAKAVAAGNSAQQEDVIATANLSRKAIFDMLTTCKVLIRASLPEQAPHSHRQAARDPRLPKADRTLESSLPRGSWCCWLGFQSSAAELESGCLSVTVERL